MADNSLNDTGLVPGTGTARDILLTPDGDLAFIGGDLVLARGDAAVAQEIAIRVRFFLGEWFLDNTAGIPYFEQVFVKPPNIERVRALLSQEIERVDGVARVEQVSIAFIGQDRRLEASYRAVLSSGQTVEGNAEV